MLKLLMQKTVKRLVGFVLFFMTYCGFCQHNLTLTVQGVASNSGKICAAIYKDESSFLKFDEVYMTGFQKATPGNTIIEIAAIPSGTYAVAIFHDENGNDKLDTNMLGIPKEPVAFSNAKMKMFGPPKFQECAFKIPAKTKISIAFD